MKDFGSGKCGQVRSYLPTLARTAVALVGQKARTKTNPTESKCVKFPLPLATNAVLVSIKPMWVWLQYAKAFVRNIATI